MKIESLKRLRLLIAMGGIVASTSFVSGCGANTTQLEESSEIERDVTMEEDITEEIPNKYLNDNKAFDKHKHLVVKIGEITYIIRGCQPEFNQISYTEGTARLLFWVYDKDKNKIIDGITSEYNIFDIDTYLEEQAIQEIEDDLIENGAKLYKGLGN
ncbi:MAG: hypothetical protein K2G03_04785 [Bacilli bacterium]|nr:hypothetical protein [Bacilli bacterium]